MPTITHLGEEVYYVECTRPVMTYEKCLKAVRCEKSEICKSNPCEECLTPEEFSNKYGDKVVGPWKGQPGI